MEKVIIDYSKEQDDSLDNFGQYVYNHLNGNANFTWQADVLTGFQTKITNYRVKLEASRHGSDLDIDAKNVARGELLKELRILGMDVNRQANGDYSKLLSSGFRMVKTKTPVGVLPKPTGFVVRTGRNSAEMFMEVDPCKGVKIYDFYVSEVPAPEDIEKWRRINSTRCRTYANGFIPGKQYEFKAAYKGTSEEIVFSDPIFIYAQ